MPEYSVIIQIETAITARSQRQAEERAEQIADYLRTFSRPPTKLRWFPDEVEATGIDVTEEVNS